MGFKRPEVRIFSPRHRSDCKIASFLYFRADFRLLWLKFMPHSTCFCKQHRFRCFRASAPFPPRKPHFRLFSRRFRGQWGYNGVIKFARNPLKLAAFGDMVLYRRGYKIAGIRRRALIRKPNLPPSGSDSQSSSRHPSAPAPCPASCRWRESCRHRRVPSSFAAF